MVTTNRVFLGISNYRAIKEEFIAIDLETTGMNKLSDDIIEIGAVRFVNGFPVDEYCTLVQSNKLSWKITQLTGITQAMLDEAGMQPKIALNELASFLDEALLGNTIICAHNAHFDIGFIKEAFERYGISANLTFIDTCVLSRRTIKGLDNYKQTTVLNYYGIKNEKEHRAIYDAKSCGYLLYKLIEDNKQFENYMNTRTEIRTCPWCGKPMKKRVAKSGQFAGREFWGCSAYPKCKCIVNIETDELKSKPASDVDYVSSQSHTSVVDKYVRLNAGRIDYVASAFEGFDAMESFNTVGVSKGILDDVKNEQLDEKLLQAFSRFRVDYSGQRNTSLTSRQRQVCALALRFLCRGNITIYSEKVEDYLKTHYYGCDYNVDSLSSYNLSFGKNVEYPFDSENERLFSEIILKNALGEDWRHYTEAQVLISSLVPESNEFVDQRVDFLLSDGETDLVIELDGPEHDAKIANDRSRDAILSKNGYKVLRIPNDAIDNNPGDIVDKIQKELNIHSKNNPEEHSFAEMILLGKSIYQAEVAVLTALMKGYISPESSIGVDISLPSYDDPQSVTSLILNDLAELLDHYCNLYKEESFFRCTAADAYNNDVAICFGNASRDDRCSILVNDICIGKTINNKIPGFSELFIEDAPESILKYFLNYCFRFSSFMEGQYEALSRLLEGRDSIVLLPTGSGKSLIYQLGSLLVPGKIIVVDPLIALMEDQIFNLHYNGIDCAIAISSNNREAIKDITRNDVSMVFVSPERLQMQSFRDSIETVQVMSRICVVAIDEAHCVSEWGHDFRTAYLNIGRTTRTVFDYNGRCPTIVALTGTASTAVLKDVKRELEIYDYDSVITPESFNRKELHFAVFPSRSDDKDNKLREIVYNMIPDRFGESPYSFYELRGEETNGGIVFCPHVNGDYGIVTAKRVLGNTFISSDIYSGSEPKGIDKANWEQQKRVAASNFKKNKVNTLVATKAFGMGIDKPNVRFTIHYGIPSSLEAFYQEAGRAGRWSKESNSKNRDKEAFCAVIISDDNSKQDDMLLNPLTPLDRIKTIIDHQQIGEKDDVSRMLWFHINSFKGIETELKNVEKVLSVLFKNGYLDERSVEIDYGKNSQFDNLDMLQKAIQRLLVLGIVSDYTVDFSQKKIKLFPGSVEKDSIKNKYAVYVRGYNEGRVASEINKIESIEADSDYRFALGSAKVLTEFIYDTIEKGRRRGLREMRSASLAALKSNDPDETLRQRIVRYFETTYADELNLITDDPNLGFNMIPEIIGGREIPESHEVAGGIRSASEASGLRGGASRYLESTPDHPGLLAIRALAELLCKDYDAEQIGEDILASCKYAVTRYSYSPEKLSLFLNYFMEKVVERDPTLFSLIVEKIIDYCDVMGLSERILDSNNLSEESKSSAAELYFGEIAKRLIDTVLSMKGDE